MPNAFSFWQSYLNEPLASLIDSPGKMFFLLSRFIEDTPVSLQTLPKCFSSVLGEKLHKVLSVIVRDSPDSDLQLDE